MRSLRPWHALLIVLIVSAAVLGTQYLVEGRSHRTSFTRVSPGADGSVRLDVGDLSSGAVRFFEYLNPANQEVRFFVGRDPGGTVEVAFDASEVCAKKGRGFHSQGEWMVCNSCDKAFRLSEVNADSGGCAPAALKHRLEGNQLVLRESDLLAGWRLFH